MFHIDDENNPADTATHIAAEEMHLRRWNTSAATPVYHAAIIITLGLGIAMEDSGSLSINSGSLSISIANGLIKYAVGYGVPKRQFI